MKRLFVPLIVLVAVLTVASGCDVRESNVAATVGGKEITVDQVRSLTAELAVLEKKPAPSGGLLDGTLARTALSQRVVLLAAQQELARRKGSVTSADRQQASQGTQSYSSLPKVVQDELSTVGALTRVIASNTKSPEVKKLIRQVYANVPKAQRQQICAQAIAGPPDAADQVEQMINAGASLTDPTAFEAQQFQPISSTGSYCTNPAQLPTEIQKPWATAPKGVLQRVAFTSQAQDGSSQQGVIFFKVTGTAVLKPSDPGILQSVQQEIEQQPNLVLPPVFAKADIHVDPRFGSGFTLGTGVTSPAAPVVPTTRPKPKVKVTQPTASAPSDTTPTSTPADSAPADTAPTSTPPSSTPSG